MGFISFAVDILRDPTQRKHFYRWIESFKKDYLFKKQLPWLVFDAIDFLNSLSLENKRVFEFGSGSSTLFWLTHRSQLISIEHDQSWYYKLRNKYLRNSECDYRLIPPENFGCRLIDASDPDNYASFDELFPCHTFWNYCNQVEGFPDNYFDLISVDGRARPSCIKHSYQKVKIGGLLILDNSDRDYYLKMTSKFLQSYDRIIFRGSVPGATWYGETSVFVRKY